MIDAAEISASTSRALAAAPTRAAPFRHWLLENVFPPRLIAGIRALPIAPPHIADTRGKRETHNATRRYVTPELRRNWRVAGALAEAFQAPATAASIAACCGRGLAGSLLRMEYCQDTDGFWLEPHTDIRVKLVTLLVYLSQPPAGEEWGTDLYQADLSPAGRAPCAPGRGLLFAPAADTWHGFARRPISGVRQSLIVNYVTREWRSREELAFPDRPIE